MAKFNTSRRKLFTIWNRVDKTERNLAIKSNQIKRFFTENHKIKTIKNLHDSGFESFAPSSATSFTVATNGKPVEEQVDFEKEIDFTLTEELLPFLRLSLIVQTPPTVKAVALLTYDQESWSGDYIRVKGDNQLIYQGDPIEIGHLFTQTEFDSGDIAQDNTKKVWQLIMEYTNGSQHFRVVGNISKLEFYEDLGTGCDSKDFDEWNIAVDPAFTSDIDNEHRIFDITDNGTLDLDVNFKGDKIEHRFTGISPSCTDTPTQIDNVTDTKNFQDVDRFVVKWGTVTTKFELDSPGGSVIGSTPFGGGEIDSDDVTVTNINTSFQGYNLYYSDETRWLFGVEDVLDTNPPFDPIPDGIYNQKQLANLPELVFPNATASLPYGSITFERHPDGFPFINSAEVEAVGDHEKIYFRLNELENSVLPNAKRYRLFFSGTVILEARATKKNPLLNGEERQVPVYDDIYTTTATTYEVTTEDHTLKGANLWGSFLQDVELKFKLDIINPFYWNEVRGF